MIILKWSRKLTKGQYTKTFHLNFLFVEECFGLSFYLYNG